MVGSFPSPRSVAEIDPALADTARSRPYGVAPKESANCVVVSGEGRRHPFARAWCCPQTVPT